MHGVVFCSQILFSSATVPFRTIFLSLAEFKSDLSWTNLKLPSSATWPFIEWSLILIEDKYLVYIWTRQQNDVDFVED